MEPAKITLMHHTAKKPDGSYVDDPVIVKIAKLALILADKDTDMDTKLLCLKACERMGFITEEESKQLLFYKGTLESFWDD